MPELALGDHIELIVDERKSELCYSATDELRPGLRFEIRHRTPNRLEIGSRVKAWVYRINAEDAFVSIDPFGRFAISDRMRPRYRVAIAEGLQYLSTGRIADKEALADLKGMFNRIRREDQWDWFTVWSLFQFVDRDFVARCAFRVASFSRDTKVPPRLAWRSEDDEALKAILHAAAEALLVRKRDLSAGGAKRPAMLTNKVRGEWNVISQYSSEKLEWANQEHERCLGRLQSVLRAMNYDIEENRFVDLFCRLKSGPAIFEVKSIHDDNEISQCRTALSQLYEYRYREKMLDASLWIVFSRKPKTDWLINYLEHDRDVRTLWFEQDGLAGHSTDRLIESGSSAIKMLDRKAPMMRHTPATESES